MSRRSIKGNVRQESLDGSVRIAMAETEIGLSVLGEIVPNEGAATGVSAEVAIEVNETAANSATEVTSEKWLRRIGGFGTIGIVDATIEIGSNETDCEKNENGASGIAANEIAANGLNGAVETIGVTEIAGIATEGTGTEGWIAAVTEVAIGVAGTAMSGVAAIEIGVTGAVEMTEVAEVEMTIVGGTEIETSIATMIDVRFAC